MMEVKFGLLILVSFGLTLAYKFQFDNQVLNYCLAKC